MTTDPPASQPGNLHLTRTGEVATLTLSAKKGSMGLTFWDDLYTAAGDLQAGQPGGARVLILRGQELFSAGLNVAESAVSIGGALGDQTRFRAVVAPMHRAFEAVAALPIPVIAAVHGWCIGAGLELISAADLRLCSSDARFSLPEVTLGIIADLGGLQRLPGIIGQGWTRQLALTGQPIDAGRAAQIGLVTEVLPTPDELYARADELAAHLAGLPPRALEGTKRVLNAALPHHDSLMQAVDWNARHLDPQILRSQLKK